MAPKCKHSLDDCVGLGHPATKSVMLGFTVIAPPPDIIRPRPTPQSSPPSNPFLTPLTTNQLLLWTHTRKRIRTACHLTFVP
jgi:hypothetical protein